MTANLHRKARKLFKTSPKRDHSENAKMTWNQWNGKFYSFSVSFLSEIRKMGKVDSKCELMWKNERKKTQNSINKHCISQQSKT